MASNLLKSSYFLLLTLLTIDSSLKNDKDNKKYRNVMFKITHIQSFVFIWQKINGSTQDWRCSKLDKFLLFHLLNTDRTFSDTWRAIHIKSQQSVCFKRKLFKLSF